MDSAKERGGEKHRVSFRCYSNEKNSGDLFYSVELKFVVVEH